MSANTPTDNSEIADEDGTTVELTSIVPQDTHSGIFDEKFGLSGKELALIVFPAYMTYHASTKWFGIPLSRKVIGASLLVGALMFFIVKNTPAHLSAVEVISRNISYVRNRMRMPLVGDDAKDIPGVVDTHPEHNALEREDSAIFGMVHVEPPNTHHPDGDGWLIQAAEFARSIDAKIEKKGFDVQIHISQDTPRIDADLERLTDIIENPDTPRTEREFADAERDYLAEWLAQSGAMERGFHIIVPVTATDALTEGANGLLDRIALNTSLAGLDANQLERQAGLLEQRLLSTMDAANSVAHAHIMDVDEMTEVLRHYWTDSRTCLSVTETTFGTGGDFPRAPEEIAGVIEPAEDPERKTDPVDMSRYDDPLTLRQRAAVASTRAAMALDTVVTTIAHAARETAAMARSAITNLPDHATEKRRFQSVFAPTDIETGPKFAQINGQYASTIWVTGWPNHPGAGILKTIESTPGVRSDTTIHIGAADRHEKAESLNKSMGWTKYAAAVQDKKADEKGDDAVKLTGDMRTFRRHILDEGVEPTETTVAITIRGQSKEILREARDDIVDRAHAAGLSTDVATKRQLEGIKTTAPTGTNDLEESTQLDTTFDMPTDTIGCLMPFCHGVFQHVKGTVYGMAMSRSKSQDGDALGLLKVDRMKLTSPHRFFVGRSGSGKSFRVKFLNAMELLFNPQRRLVIIDIARGFDGIVKLFGGSKIEVGVTRMNPFEVRSADTVNKDAEADLTQSLDDKITLLTNMFMVYLRYNTEGDSYKDMRPTLASAIRETYRTVGITRDPETHDRRSPVMEEFFDTLEVMSDNPTEYTLRTSEYEIDTLKEHAGRLLYLLQQFKRGGEYDYLNIPTDEVDDLEVSIYDRVVYYDMNKFQNANKSVKAMLTMLTLSDAYEIAKLSPEAVNVLVDEAHDVFSDTHQAGEFEKMVRAGRNTGLTFDFVSQTGKDFNEGSAAEIAKQCSIAIISDLGKREYGVARALGYSKGYARLMAGALITGDNDGTNYSEAIVDVEGECMLTMLQVPDRVAELIDYRESDHGDFESYYWGVDTEPTHDNDNDKDKDTDTMTTETEPETDAEPTLAERLATDGGEQ